MCYNLSKDGDDCCCQVIKSGLFFKNGSFESVFSFAYQDAWASSEALLNDLPQAVVEAGIAIHLLYNKLNSKSVEKYYPRKGNNR